MSLIIRIGQAKMQSAAERGILAANSNETNPFAPGTKEHTAWIEGNNLARAAQN